MKREDGELEMKDSQVKGAERCQSTSSFLPPGSRRENYKYEMSWKDVCPQVIISCVAFLIVINAGINLAYSTVLIEGLGMPNRYFVQLTKDQESWTASLVIITVPIGALIVGPLMDKFGRKKLLIATCLPMIISWILVIITSSIEMIYTARIIAGISSGMSSVSVYYVIEITHPRIRSMMVCINSIAVSLGILLVYFLTLFINWQMMAVLFLLFNIIFPCLLLFIPESPYWIICFNNSTPMSNKRIEHVERCLKRLNPRWVIYEEEFARIQQMNEKRREKLLYDHGKKSWITTLKDSFKASATPVVYKPLILLVMIFLMQQLSGCYVVITYAIQVLRKMAGNAKGDPQEYGILSFIGIVRFLMSIATAFLSKKFGRRTLLMASGLGMAACMFSSAMVMKFIPYDEEKIDQALSPLKILLMIIIVIYICMSSIGFAVLPWTLVGELLPISFRGIGGGFIMSIAYVMMFSLVKSFPLLLGTYGVANVFFFFSIFSLLGAAFVYFFLPETLGKSFLEIEEYFEKSKPKKTTETRG